MTRGLSVLIAEAKSFTSRERKSSTLRLFNNSNGLARKGNDIEEYADSGTEFSSNTTAKASFSDGIARNTASKKRAGKGK